jgi:hypothetical protein
VHLAGTVKVQVVIGPEGKIKDVKVIGGHPLLVDAVQETLKSWKYAPAAAKPQRLYSSTSTNNSHKALGCGRSSFFLDALFRAGLERAEGLFGIFR